MLKLLAVRDFLASSPRGFSFPMLHVTFNHSRQGTALHFFPLADLNSWELQSDTNSLPLLYFTPECHFTVSRQGQAPSYPTICSSVHLSVPTLHTWPSTTAVRIHYSSYTTHYYEIVQRRRKRKMSIKYVIELIQNHTNINYHRDWNQHIKIGKVKACFSPWLWDFSSCKCNRSGIIRNNPPNIENMLVLYLVGRRKTQMRTREK